MKKAICIILTAVLLLLSTVGCTPQEQTGDITSKPLSVGNELEKTLSCVKLDNEGSAIGTEQINVKLSAQGDLLQSDTHEISITPFDGLPQLIFGNELDGTPQKPRKIADEFWCVYWLTPTATNDLMSGQVYYSLDFEYWAFSYDRPNNESFENETVYFVASTSGTRTTEEIVEYFRGLVPRGESK